MPSLSLALNASTARKPIGGNSVIWRILISDAGTATSNGEYVWDGATTYDGKPIYYGQVHQIRFDYNAWALYDSDNDENLYISDDLITWTVANGASPAPTSTLYYTP